MAQCCDFLRCGVKTVIPRLHDRANIEQTSSKHRANIELARSANI